MAKDDYEKLSEKHHMKPLSEFKVHEGHLDVLETGILPLDLALGDMGPDGRVGIRARSVFEIVAYPSAGKSSALIQFIKTTLDRYGENSVVGLYAEPPDFNTFQDKGVDPARIQARCVYDPDLTTKSNLAEEWLEAMLAFAKLPETKLIFVDSVSALVTTAMIYEGSGNKEKDIEVKTPAFLANVFNNFLARYLGQCHSAVLCLTNHQRDIMNIGNIPTPSEDQLKTKGGAGIHFLSRKRCMLRVYKKYEDKDAVHSVENTRARSLISTNFVMFKRKDGCPRTTTGVLSMIDGTYNNEEKLLEYAGFFGSRRKVKEGNTEKGVTVSELSIPVASSGAWFYIGDEKFQGKENAIQYLKENPQIYDKLKYEIYARHDQLMLDQAPDFSTLLDG